MRGESSIVGAAPVASSHTPDARLRSLMLSVPLVQAGPGACHFGVLISSPGPLSPSGRVCRGGRRGSIKYSAGVSPVPQSPLCSLGAGLGRISKRTTQPIPSLAEPFACPSSKRWSATYLEGLDTGTSWAQGSGGAPRGGP